MDDLHASLQRNAPVFRVKANNISILDSPSEFYDLIIRKIYNSRVQIYLSSLYIGTDARSLKMVHFLEFRIQ